MSGHSAHIALVDDDASVRKALGCLLSAAAFETKAYSSAQDFLNSLKVEMPECLILDVSMPEISGLDLQRHMQRAGIDIPTIVITALNTPGLRERCQSAGAAGFLLKPIDGQELVGEIQLAIATASRVKALQNFLFYARCDQD